MIKDLIAEILSNNKSESSSLKALEKEIPNKVESADLFLIKLGLLLVKKFYIQLKSTREEIDAKELHMPEQGNSTH